MQNINLRYSPSIIQQLFVEKGLELLYKNTIDTYRLRLHNPKTIIEELFTICVEARDGVLTNNIYLNATSNEATVLIKRGNDALTFKSVSRKYFLNTLKSASKQNIDKLIQVCKLVLNDNRDYQNQLFTTVKTSIDSYTNNTNFSNKEKKEFILMLHYLCIELINLGYTKQYLYAFFRSIFVFVGNAAMTFDTRYQILQSLGNKQPEQFKVIYELIGSSFQFPYFKKTDPSKYEHVTRHFKNSLPIDIKPAIREFLGEKIKQDELNLISIKTKSLDYYKAVEISRAKLAHDLDIYHLGFSNNTIKIGTKTVVIGSNDTSKSSILPSNYQIDGYIRGSRTIFEILLKKFRKIKKNRVNDESLDKLISAIRYLRIGSESTELETKLLNYWIGLEYIFTSFNNDEKTIDRIINYFPVCHSVIYPKRNLYGFHKTLDRLNVSNNIPSYSKSLKYLKRVNTYENNILPNTDSELLKFRTNFYKSWVDNPENITSAIERHKQNLKWNLIRLYRIRNSIVHNAAVTDSIYSNVSHIKYYLTFILNSILEYLSTTPFDVNHDNKITIEDYFITQDIILGSLKGKPIDDFLEIKNPMEILN